MSRDASNMNVLVTVPRSTGGVANHFAVLRNHAPPGIEYFWIGAPSAEHGRVRKLLRLLKDFLRFRQALEAGNYDLVHINPSLVANSIVRDGLFLLIAKRFHQPVVIFMHGWEVTVEDKIRRHFSGLFRRVYGQADLFIVLGKVFERKLRQMGIKSRIVRESTLVKDDFFSEEITAMVNRPPNPDALHLLFLSRLDVGKGLPLTIEAYRSVLERYPGLILTIAGDGPERARMQELVENENLAGVRFLGYIDEEDKARVYTDADIFVFPTMYGEGMPAALLEAMSFGLPVITRPVGGIGDFFEDGRMGFLTESTEPSVFAELLDKLLSDPERRSKMSEYNRHFSENRFAASKVTKRLVDLYEDTLGSTRGGGTDTFVAN